MKTIQTILGTFMAILGCIWVAQGLNFLPGSVMTGDVRWAIYGSVLALGGIALVVWSRRRQSP
jgi:hypothetical protein